jgi:hypothetical protein
MVLVCPSLPASGITDTDRFVQLEVREEASRQMSLKGQSMQLLTRCHSRSVGLLYSRLAMLAQRRSAFDPRDNVCLGPLLPKAAIDVCALHFLLDLQIWVWWISGLRGGALVPRAYVETRSVHGLGLVLRADL